MQTPSFLARLAGALFPVLALVKAAYTCAGRPKSGNGMGKI